MARPLIGLTTYPPNPGDRYELPRPYVDAVRRAGGEPVLLPPGIAEPAALLDRLDGLLLAGDPTQQRLFDTLVERSATGR